MKKIIGVVLLVLLLASCEGTSMRIIAYNNEYALYSVHIGKDMLGDPSCNTASEFRIRSTAVVKSLFPEEDVIILPAPGQTLNYFVIAKKVNP